MVIRTRLDPAVAMRERNEDSSRQKLGEAAQAEERARQSLKQAEATAQKDNRKRGQAAEWQLVESAQQQARVEVTKARVALEASQKNKAVAVKQHQQAHNLAEAIRRVAESRREEIRTEREITESREHDQAGALLFWLRSR